MSRKRSKSSKPGLSFVDLPAEVRICIYQYIIRREFDVRLHLAPPTHEPITRSKAKAEPQLRLDTISQATPCGDCIEIICNTCALMQTCKTLHNDLAPTFYSIGSFMFSELPVLSAFLNNVPSDCKPLIKHISLAHRYDHEIGETSEKQQLKAMAEQLTGLHTLCWQGLDRRADAGEKGTQWKPHELRKIITVLTHSPHLSRVFYDYRGCNCCALLRFTDDTGEERENELELDPAEEYEAWKENNRTNKCLRDSWGFES